MTESVLSFDTDLLHLADVEALLAEVVASVVLPAESLVCTHVIREPRPRYAITVSVSDPASTVVEARLRKHLGGVSCEPARRERLARSEGRAVVFPGQDVLRGRMAVRDLTALSAINRVELLGGADLDPGAECDTRDFLRPLWRAGHLVLPVLPAGPGVVAPFEVPNPTPCCAGLQ